MPDTSILLHFDGADGSTTFTDESGKTWTVHGNAQINTAEKKFGTGSGLFDGSGDYIDTPDSEDFNVGSGDFTIDCWVKRAANNVSHGICGQCDSGASTASLSIRMFLHTSNIIFVGISDGSNTRNAQSTGTITDTNWHHIAFVRYGNTGTIYKDGVADGIVDLTGVTVNNSSNLFSVGRYGGYSSADFNGRIDEFRFVKGVAKWTSNFTPPTAPYSFGWVGKIFGVTPAKIFGVVPKKVCGI